MKIRGHVADEIVNNLAMSFCGLENFIINWNVKGMELCKITFAPQPNYFLELSENGGYPNTLAARASPGDLKHEEIYGGLSIDEALDQIYGWTGRIEEELRSFSKEKQSTDEILAEISSKIDENIENPEENFESSEIQNLKDRLETLSVKFDELYQSSKITEEELKKLKAQIVTAEQDLPIYTKGVWYKLHMNKIFSTLKKAATSKEGREVITAAIKKFLENF